MVDGGGPLPAWLAPIAWSLARAYGIGVAFRNARFDRGAGVRRLEVEGVRPPVISVGNLTAGGTGKSPMVAWIARELAAGGGASGPRVLIALRGYRGERVGAASRAGRARSHAVHSDESLSGELRSDEALEYAVTAPSAEVVVGAARRERLVERLARPDAASWRDRACVLLDDGFQHRRLARDLDIVLVDATRPGLDGDLLPMGWLREPARNIARADLVILTKAHDPASRARAAELVARARGRPHDAACEHAWLGLEVIAAAPARAEERGGARPVDWLAGRGVVSACALGNPAHFHDAVERAGARVVARLGKADHRPFSLAELERAAERAGVGAVVVSRKDLVKLAGLPSSRIDLVVPELGIAFIDGAGEARVRAALAAVVARASISGRAARA
ncbi:MAG: Tetraacyldisaccharide 4-kinase [Planctomycetota bacterium]